MVAASRPAQSSGSLYAIPLHCTFCPCILSFQNFPNLLSNVYWAVDLSVAKSTFSANCLDPAAKSSCPIGRLREEDRIDLAEEACL